MDEILLPTACRCCLMEDKDMVYVFDVLDEFSMKISELIVRNGAITILENDAFSKHICGNCLNDLAIAERFVLRCQKTHDLLASLIEDDLSENNISLMTGTDILSDPAEDVVSYVLIPAAESALFEEISIGTGEASEFKVSHSSLQDDAPVQTAESGKSMFGPDVEKLGTIETCLDGGKRVQLVYDSNVLEDCEIIDEEEINMNDELYDKILDQSGNKHLSEHIEASNDPAKDAYDEHLIDNEKGNITDSDEDYTTKIVSGKLFDFKHSCDHCGASFVTTQNYARHLLLHKVLACHQCLEVFDSDKHLGSHQMKCQRGPVRHASAIASEHQLNAANSSRTKDLPQRKKSFVCPYCDKLCVSQSALATHQRIHTGERPFGCNFCPKRFKTLAGVDLHERRHSGVKRYTCPVCDKRFLETSNLKVHMLQHTKEKPHVCTVCNRAFARVFLLQLHMRTHTGEKPYRCETCGQQFAQQGDLASHRRMHSGERPHVCNICGKSFIKSSAARKHLKCHEKHMQRENEECVDSLSDRIESVATES